MMSHPLYFPFQRDIFSDARKKRRNRNLTLLAVGSALMASAIGAFFFFGGLAV